MADWKQIRARIRRAKASADPAAKLQQLFEKTRDAMVAYELGELQERAGQMAAAALWYERAAGGFRRAEWKNKAREALERVRAALPAASAGGHVLAATVEFTAQAELLTTASAEPVPATSTAGEHPVEDHSPTPPRPATEPEAPKWPLELNAAGRPATPVVRVYRRIGEPALASEIAALEGRLRQLLASNPVPLGQLDQLPASPGTYVLSDTELATVYWVGACSNLRAAIEQMLAGRRRSARGAFRNQLARYLGIGDQQATRYLKQHCAVRWLELEETDAQALAHFARAVLRPELTEEVL